MTFKYLHQFTKNNLMYVSKKAISFQAALLMLSRRYNDDLQCNIALQKNHY
jgi:hypothetical protein